MNSMNISQVEEREKDNLQNFKKVVRDMVLLLRTSMQAETVSMHWVNANRDIFVLAGYATVRKDVVYQDRVRRENHFLRDYSNIKSLTRLEQGTHFEAGELSHYTSTPPVTHIYLIPFVYNAETVAITTVETAGRHELVPTDEQVITAYRKVLGRMLQSYQEVADLAEKQTEWVDYDQMVGDLMKAEDPLDLVTSLVDNIQHYIGENGGVVLLARGMNDWHTVLHSLDARYPPPIGLALEKGSVAAHALTEGEPFFSPHLNGNPKRISASEPLCYGASLALPILHRQRRQLLILAYSENMLIFSEALKYKISNLCRSAGLKLESMLPNLDISQNIFSTGLTSYTRELIYTTFNRLTQHARHRTPALSTWVGMISIGNINDLRTRYRLDDLTNLQQQILMAIRPQNHGIPGIVGAHSDYVYTFILQSTDESSFLGWTGRIRELFREPFAFAVQKREPIRINTGVTRLNGVTEPDEVLQKVKRAVNEAVRMNKFIVEV